MTLLVAITRIVRAGSLDMLESFTAIQTIMTDNRPFSYSENECGSNDTSSQFLEFSNVHNCDRSSNATLSSLAYKIV